MIYKKILLKSRVYLKRKVLSISNPKISTKYLKDNNFNVFLKTILGSITVILTFFFIPLLIDFNKEVGSTVFIPQSHKLNRKPENLIETKSFSNQEYLETKLGDIFISSKTL